MRQPGIEAAEETAIAMGAVRLGILPIRLLRFLGYEGAEETVAASPPAGASLAPLRKGQLPLRQSVTDNDGKLNCAGTVTDCRPTSLCTREAMARFLSEVQSTPSGRALLATAVGAVRLGAPTDTVFAGARLREYRQNRICRAAHGCGLGWKRVTVPAQ